MVVLHFNPKTKRFCESTTEIDECWKFMQPYHNVLLKKLDLMREGYKSQSFDEFKKELR